MGIPLIGFSLTQENMIMAIRGEAMATDDAESGENAAPPPAQNIVYVIHPNCAIEDF